MSPAETDPCDELDCVEHEWCGQQDGVYGCFCDEYHQRGETESYGTVLAVVTLTTACKEILAFEQ